MYVIQQKTAKNISSEGKQQIFHIKKSLFRKIGYFIKSRKALYTADTVLKKLSKCGFMQH
jgi:hypothetical protein